MSADIVNLSKFRKQKEKSEKNSRSAANRAKFGRNKGEKLADQNDAKKTEKKLSGQEFGDDPEPA